MKTCERDWVEDATHENGQYQNQCVSCFDIFIGHKRRVTCRICAGRRLAPHGYFVAKVQVVIAWFDLWVGAYWDRKGGWLYVLPVPCLGVRMQVPTPKAVMIEMLQRLVIWRSGIRVYAMNECDWWTGRSAEEALADYMKTTGLSREEALEGEDAPHEINGEALRRLKFNYDEQMKRVVRFQDRLLEIVWEREAVPSLFASTEY